MCEEDQDPRCDCDDPWECEICGDYVDIGTQPVICNDCKRFIARHKELEDEA